MKILITGANGFIGSFLVEEAIKQGWDTFAAIRPSSHRAYLKDERIQFLYLSYANRSTLVTQLHAFKREHGLFDYIIHNAGVTKCNRKSDFDTINREYTKNFVDALIEADMVPRKFIYMSSLSAWGSGNPKTLEPIMLCDKPHPDTAYGVSKLKAEAYISSIEGFPYIFMRPTGVYGPREKDYFLINKSIKNGIELSVGFKPQYITFIYVRDLVRLVFDALKSPIVQKGYFVSDGHVYTNTEYASIVKKILHKKYTLKIKVPLFLVKGVAVCLDMVYGWFGKSPTLNRDKYNIISATNWKCEIEPTIQDFSFVARYDLEKGMEEAIEWYKQEGWL